MKRTRSLSFKEINLLLQTIEYNPVGLRDRLMLGFTYGCMIEPEEAINLSMEDVYLQERKIIVIKRKIDKIVNLPDKVFIYLRDYINYGRNQLLLGIDANTNKSLLITYQGKSATVKTLYKRLKHLQKKDKKLKRKSITFRILRESRKQHLKKNK